MRLGPFAADEAVVSKVREVSRGKVDGRVRVTYEWEIRHTGELTYDRLPMDVEVPLYQKFVSATLAPNRLERLGRVQSWNNVTSGIIPYVFYNYHRVSGRTTAAQQEESLSLMDKELLPPQRDTCSNHAPHRVNGRLRLARLDFAGRNSLFFLTLFSMMIPPGRSPSYPTT